MSAPKSEATRVIAYGFGAGSATFLCTLDVWFAVAMTAALIVAAIIAGLLWGAAERAWAAYRAVPRSRAFCPSCRRDLLGDERVGVYERVDGTTELRCVCDCVSRWDLDAPVPLMLPGASS
jgi:hypothetical protein